MRLKIFLYSSIFITFFNFSCNKQPVACFEFEPTEVYIFDTVEFFNCSENAEKFFWDFGDDSISTSENPKHVYTYINETPTIYTIKLIAQNGENVDITSKKIIVHHWGEIFEGDYVGNQVIIENNDTIVFYNHKISASFSAMTYKLYWVGFEYTAYGDVISKNEFKIKFLDDSENFKGFGFLDDDRVFIQMANSDSTKFIFYQGKKI